jgi:GMP synthase (glutamine-hydrolysing)
MQPRALLVVHHDARDAGRAPGVLERAGLDVRIWNIAKERRMPAISNYEGMVVFGGGMTPYQEKEFPWIGRELAAIEKAFAREKPLLGICLGAQMMCVVRGGRVRPARRAEREFSYLRVASGDMLVNGLPDIFPMYGFHSHEMILPKGVREFLTGNLCPQGVRFGPEAWGLQFHPEANWPLVSFWHRRLEFLLRDEGTDTRAQNRHFWRHAWAQRKNSQKIFNNWAAHIKEINS